MQTERDHDIIHLSFISLSKVKIAFSLLLLAAIAYFLSRLSLLLAIAVPLYLVLVAIHAINNHWKAVVKWLYWKHEWGSEEAKYLAVYTPASRAGGRHSCPKVFVETIRSRVVDSSPKEVEAIEPRKLQESQEKQVKRQGSEKAEGIKAENTDGTASMVEVIFTFNQEVYRAVANRAEKVADIQKLKLLQLQDLLAHAQTGLAPQFQQRSTQLFGQQRSFLSLSFLSFISLNLSYSSGWLFLSLLSLLTTFHLSYNKLQPIFTQTELFIFWLQLSIFCTIILLILLDSILSSRKFSQQYSWISNLKFTVIRNSKEQEVALHELTVGDVVKFDSADGFKVWFRGVLTGQNDLTVREGLQDKVKMALNNISSHADSNSTIRNHIIHMLVPQSKVVKTKHSQNVLIIVTDPNIINKYFQSWFQKEQKRQFPPLKQRYWNSAIQLTILAFFIVIVAYITFSKINKRDILPLNQHIKDTLISVLCLPIVLFFLERLALLYFSLKLSLRSITLYTPSLPSATTSSTLFINFSRLLHLQFQSILYKNKLLGFQTQLFQPSALTLKNGSTYQSLLAVILYISLGHFQQQNNSPLARVYQKFQEYFEYNGDDVEHLVSGKRWEVIKSFKENQEGVRSWMLQFDSKSFYLISEVQGKAGEVFRKLGEKEDNRKKQAYITAAKELQAEGKFIQIMFFRNLREERLRESDKSSGDYANQSRELLQKDYQFGTFLIFDHALLAQTVSDIEELKSVEKSNLHIRFIAENSKEELAGFEHILTNIPFIYDCTEHQIGVSTRFSMEQSGCMFLGGGVEDHCGFSVADLTLSIRRQGEQFCLPSDITIKTIADVQYIIQKSKTMFDTCLQAFRLALASGLFALIGTVYLDRKYQVYMIDSKFKTNMIVMICFVVVPTLVRMLIEGRDREPEENKKEGGDRLQGIFSTSFFLAILVSLLVAVGAIFFFQTHGLCQTASKTSALTLRTQTSPLFYCKNLVMLLSTTACTLAFICFYGGRNWIKQPYHYLRLLLLAPWGYLLFLDGFSTLVISAGAGLIVAIVLLRIIVSKCAK